MEEKKEWLLCDSEDDEEDEDEEEEDDGNFQVEINVASVRFRGGFDLNKPNPKHGLPKRDR